MCKHDFRGSIALTDKNTLLDFASAMSAKNLSVYPYQDKKGGFSVLTQKDIVRALGNAGGTSSYRCGSTLMLEHLMTEKFTIHHLRYFLRKFLHIRCLIHEYNISI